jgi:hypothetical protein
MDQLIAEYEAASETEIVEQVARDASGKLWRKANGEFVTERISKKESLRRTLEARVAYTVRKMEEQLVDLGASAGDRAEHMSSLALALGRAQAELGFSEIRVKNALEARLNNILDIREDKIELNRKIHLSKQVLRGALMGATFSGAGLAIGSVLPGHEAVGTLELPHASPTPVETTFTPNQAHEVGEVIRHSTVGVGVPRELAQPNLDARARAFEEYMGADAATRAQIAETLSTTTTAMDTEIAQTLHGAVTSPDELLHASISPGEELVIDHAPTPSPEAVASIYTVKAEDNLTAILKSQIPEIRSLPASIQENAVQNLIKSLSPDEMQKLIGSNDPSVLGVANKIDLAGLSKHLHTAQFAGADIIEHAQRLASSSPSVPSEHVLPTPEKITTASAPVVVHEPAAPVVAKAAPHAVEPSPDVVEEPHVVVPHKSLPPPSTESVSNQAVVKPPVHQTIETKPDGTVVFTPRELPPPA